MGVTRDSHMQVDSSAGQLLSQISLAYENLKTKAFFAECLMLMISQLWILTVWVPGWQWNSQLNHMIIAEAQATQELLVQIYK